MKHFLLTTVLGSVILTVSNVVNAQSPAAPGRQEGPENKPGLKCCHGAPEMCRQQPDDIDELLIIVMKPEGSRRAMPHHGGKMGSRAGHGRSRGEASCPMMAEGQRGGCPEGGSPGPMMDKGKSDVCPQFRQPSGTGGHKGMRMHKFGGMERKLLKEYLLKNYAKEVEAIAAAKKTHDEALKEVVAKFKTLVDKARADLKARRDKAREERKQFIELVEAYKKTKDAKVQDQLKAKLSEFYDQRLERMKDRIDAEAARVQKASDKYKELAADKDKEIEQELAKIIR
ncbi:MAG: hypothetical protein PHH77_09825 [Victivallaceae bacterium]|nr:hypothetical protein [Victivallaceae bacterium]